KKPSKNVRNRKKKRKRKKKGRNEKSAKKKNGRKKPSKNVRNRKKKRKKKKEGQERKEREEKERQEKAEQEHKEQEEKETEEKKKVDQKNEPIKESADESAGNVSEEAEAKNEDINDNEEILTELPEGKKSVSMNQASTDENSKVEKDLVGKENSGTVVIEEVPNFNFGSKEYTTTAGRVNLENETLSVYNGMDNNSWQITMKIDPFVLKINQHTMPWTGYQIHVSSSTKTESPDDPHQLIASAPSFTNTDNVAKNVLGSSKGRKGLTKVNIHNIMLEIPANSLPGQYEAAITWTVHSGNQP
ncbi:WxL domain-containing protein, partial [Lactiplantibacillus songbeiensis]